jgi:hypothetical protein
MRLQRFKQAVEDLAPGRVAGVRGIWATWGTPLTMARYE